MGPSRIFPAALSPFLSLAVCPQLFSASAPNTLHADFQDLPIGEGKDWVVGLAWRRRAWEQ